jgi:hypothetical protein
MLNIHQDTSIAKACLGLAGAFYLMIAISPGGAQAAMSGEAEAAAAYLDSHSAQWDDVKPRPGEFAPSRSWSPAEVTETVPLATSSLRTKIWTDDYRPAPPSFYVNQ